LKAEDVIGNYKDRPFPTNLQIGDIPYPPGVVTACFLEVGDLPDSVPRVSPDDYDIMLWTGPTKYEDYQGQQLVVCDLLSSQVDLEHMYKYTVRARLQGGDDIIQVNDVPHAAITLKDGPYMSDIHAPGSYRRWIGIPDERFPQKWRNLRE